MGFDTPVINRNLLIRHLQVAEHLQSSIDSLAPTAVAAALVILRSDGTIDTSAIGAEPEYLPFVLRGLDQISARLTAPAQNTRPRHRNQHGCAIISIALSLAFAAATYINEYAWLDALLTIAAQIAATWATERGHHRLSP